MEETLSENTPTYKSLLFLGGGIMEDFYFLHNYPVINTIVFIRIWSDYLKKILKFFFLSEFEVLFTKSLKVKKSSLLWA